MRLLDVQPQAVHGGTLRVFLARHGTPAGAVAEMLAAERAHGLHREQCYADFSARVRRLQDSLREGLAARRSRGARVAAYGAPAKGNTLLNSCGIDSRTVEFTVDRSPHKQGLLLPGSRIPVRPVEELARSLPDYAVLLPWNLEAEIVSQQQDYVNRGGRFLVPVPELREVGA
jgi:hypothetical protein